MSAGKPATIQRARGSAPRLEEQMKQVRIQSINHLHLLAQRLDFHIFRGEKQNWELKPKVRRVLDSLKIEPGNFKNRENNLIKEFKSRIGQYSPHHHSVDDILELCSLMQHYGAPTRLLDFTRSLYVAAFFAVEDVEYDGDSYLWCLNEMMLRDKIVPREEMEPPDGNAENAQYLSMSEFARKELSDSPSGKSGLLILEPEKKNERISRQQGLFLMQRSLTDSTQANLFSVFETTGDPEEIQVSDLDKANYSESLLKIIISKEVRLPILKDLNKMNINHEILFPGLDGFCKSLYSSLGL